MRGHDNVREPDLVWLDGNSRRPVSVRYGVVRSAVEVGIVADRGLRRTVEKAWSSEGSEQRRAGYRRALDLIEKRLWPIGDIAHDVLLNSLNREVFRRRRCRSGR